MFDLLFFFFFKCSPVLHILSVILCCFISPTCLLSVLSDLYCTLEVDSFGYFVSKAKTRVFRDTTEPQWNEVSRKDIFFSFLIFFNCAVFIFIVLLVYIRVTAQEFEIELEGSQYLRILCYEKCYDKSMLNKDDNEIVDKIMGKGQVQVGDRL